MSVKAVFSIFLFGVVFNISRWFELEIIKIPDPDKNDTITILKVLLFPLLSKEVNCLSKSKHLNLRGYTGSWYTLV